MTILYALCVWLAWAPSTGAEAHYFYEDQLPPVVAFEPEMEICKVDDEEHAYFVEGFDANSVSEPSDVLTVKWQHNFDADGDGVVGFPDFALLTDAFGTNDSRFDSDGNGAVGFPDFAAFTKAFGDCNDGIKKVDC